MSPLNIHDSFNITSEFNLAVHNLTTIDDCRKNSIRYRIQHGNLSGKSVAIVTKVETFLDLLMSYIPSFRTLKERMVKNLDLLGEHKFLLELQSQEIDDLLMMARLNSLPTSYISQYRICDHLQQYYNISTIPYKLFQDIGHNKPTPLLENEQYKLTFYPETVNSFFIGTYVDEAIISKNGGEIFSTKSFKLFYNEHQYDLLTNREFILLSINNEFYLKQDKVIDVNVLVLQNMPTFYFLCKDMNGISKNFIATLHIKQAIKSLNEKNSSISMTFKCLHLQKDSDTDSISEQHFFDLDKQDPLFANHVIAITNSGTK